MGIIVQLDLFKQKRWKAYFLIYKKDPIEFILRVFLYFYQRNW